MFSYVKKPDIPEKMTALAESARYDVCMSSCSSGARGRSGRSRNPENPLTEWIYPASVPGQGKVHILKILQSNSCRNNCTYCQFAAGNPSIRRTSMSAEELAAGFMMLVRSRLVEGIFLSSGVCSSPSKSMQEMVKTAEILRKNYRFGGYIHLKVIPGCDEHLIETAAAYANRLSINMEAPSAARLKSIAPDKNLETDIKPAAMKIAGLIENRNKQRVKAASQTTQFVVGAAGESDIEILTTVDRLYRDAFMFRSYFSAFQSKASCGGDQYGGSITGSPFEGSPLLREHRLYQCDFLLRAYGFRFPDLIFDGDGNIPLETDPKTAWAVMHPELYPVEINKASVDELLKVPGIGPVSAERIIRERENSAFTGIDSLKAVGAWTNRAAGWIEIGGKTPRVSAGRRSFNHQQKWLFEELAPSSWNTGGKNADRNYDYPAQRGKWVNYQFKRTDKRVYCR